MKDIKVYEDRCQKNHPCPVVRICPAGAIQQRTFFSAPEIDAEKCTKCGKCAKYCGYGAFQVL